MGGGHLPARQVPRRAALRVTGAAQPGRAVRAPAHPRPAESDRWRGRSAAGTNSFVDTADRPPRSELSPDPFGRRLKPPAPTSTVDRSNQPRIVVGPGVVGDVDVAATRQRAERIHPAVGDEALRPGAIAALGEDERETDRMSPVGGESPHADGGSDGASRVTPRTSRSSRSTRSPSAPTRTGRRHRPRTGSAGLRRGRAPMRARRLRTPPSARVSATVRHNRPAARNRTPWTRTVRVPRTTGKAGGAGATSSRAGSSAACTRTRRAPAWSRTGSI